MKDIHTKILTKQQEELLPLVKLFSKDYYLVGGTAISLHIGHRYSIDFDLFTSKTVFPRKITEKIYKGGFKIQKTLFSEEGQGHYLVNGVKMTFYSFPYHIDATYKVEKYIKMPDLLTLASMKAFAISERGKWKDYVDLYYILKYHILLRKSILKSV